MVDDMIEYELLIVLLTRTMVDSVKLAVMDVGQNVSPGFNNDLYQHDRGDEFFGCIMLVKFQTTINNKQQVFDALGKALATRGVEYLGIRVHSTKEGALAAGGTLKRSAPRHAEGPYREQG